MCRGIHSLHVFLCSYVFAPISHYSVPCGAYPRQLCTSSDFEHFFGQSGYICHFCNYPPQLPPQENEGDGMYVGAARMSCMHVQYVRTHT